MQHEELSTVTITGRIAEKPSFSETATGVLLAHFWVELGNNRVWCVCTGWLAENVRRFAHADVEIVGAGVLDWTRDRPEQPHVHLHQLAFANPREIAELKRWSLRP